MVLTHGHPDHIWGTVLADGALRFPNATYYAGAAEWDFWNHDDVWTKLPDAQRPFAIGARRQYAAVRDRVIMMRSGDEVISGIRAIATPGHTPGHLSFEVSGGDGLIIVGDVVTTPSVYFPNPKWTFGFDATTGRPSTVVFACSTARRVSARYCSVITGPTRAWATPSETAQGTITFRGTTGRTLSNDHHRARREGRKGDG